MNRRTASFRRWPLVVSHALLVFAFVLTACRPQPAPTATPAPTVAPTGTPLPPLPPVLVETSPDRGEELPPDGAVRLVFDQPMDKSSVESAFKVSPPVAGTFSWPDDTTVQFKPTSPLDRNTTYDAVVGTDAKSAAGLALVAPLSVKFSTVGFLEVAQVLPAPDTQEAEADTDITAIFNRPVVPLTGLAQQAGLPQPLIIQPDTKGKGEWLNTSIYVFHPDPALKAGTTYQVRIAAGLTDVTGGVLQNDYLWSFTTVSPRVLFTDPNDGQSDVALNHPITVTFNQSMDHPSTEAAFAVTDASGAPVAGTFRWLPGSALAPTSLSQSFGTGGKGGEGGGKPLPPSAEALEFTPRQPLALDGRYTAKIAGSAKAVEGSASLGKAYQWRFNAVRRPAILRTEPANGDATADLGRFAIFFASPMDVRTLERNLTITPKPTSVYTYYNEFDHSFSLGFPPKASTAYEVHIGGDMADPYGNKLGQETVVRFTTRPFDPTAYLNVPGTVGTYNAYTPTVVYAVHLNVSRLDFELDRLDLPTFVRLTGPNSYEELNNFKPARDALIRAWSVPVSVPLNQSGLVRADLAATPGGKLAPGIYYLQLTAPEVRAPGPGGGPIQLSRHLLVVSGASLTVKTGLHEALVWATDLQSGQVLTDLPVKLYDPDFKPVGDGVTDKDGVALLPLSGPVQMWNPYYAVVQTSGSGPTSFALTINQWSDGIGPWDFNLGTQFDDRPYQVYLYTDKPIYRPGQTVHFKGIARAADNARYSLPGDLRELPVTIQDNEGKQVFSQTLPLGPMSTFYGDFQLSEAAGLGYYSLQTVVKRPTAPAPGLSQVLGSQMLASQTLGSKVLGGGGVPSDFTFGIGFQVAQYRRPEFQVKVTADRAQVLQGDDINVTAGATYFFGAPVADAPVHWTVLSADHPFVSEGPGNYDFSDYDFTAGPGGGPVYSSYGELIAEGDGRTDAQGHFTFTVPANLGKKTMSQQFTIEVTVTDTNAQAVSGRTAVTVHKGQYYIGLQPESYVGQIGQPQKVNLITVDWTGLPYGQVELTVVVSEHKWYSVQQQDASGNLQWTWTVEDKPVYTTTVTTEQGGVADITFTPAKGGTYKVLATGHDTRGNEVRASTYLWISSGEFIAWRIENNDRIELRPDRTSYTPGDTANILIPSPYQGEATALVTIERERIMQRQLLTLKSNSEVLHLPISADYAPNVFVSVMIVKGVDATNPTASFKLGYVQLKVSPEQQELKVTLTPDKSKLGPRDTVNYDVQVTDYTGRPAQAEFSLGLVDLSVLSLADPNAPPLVDSFYGPQGLGFRTASGLTIAVERYNMQAARGFKGGGGGGGAPGAFQIRQEFPDTAYWNPAVMTDASGHAKVEIRLPDTLTTWRLDARGATAETLVGQSTVDIVTTKDLLIRPVTPRFFVVGDKAQLAAIVNNNTDRTIDAQVGLAANGLDLASPATQSAQVPAHGQARVTWDATVNDVTAADLTFTVSGGGLSDASKPPLGQPPDQLLPVYKYSSPETVGTAGEVAAAGDRTEAVALPRQIDPTQGQLSIEIDPSLAAATRDGLTYLEGFPYECTEQTVSRFLPNVVTYRALKALNIQNPDLEKRLPDLISLGLQRLYSGQHVDGGWGWWLNDQSNPTVTAYVLFGLAEAREAGFDVNPSVMAQASDYLRGQLLAPAQLKSPPDADRQAFILYALAEAGNGDTSATVNLFDNRQKLDTYGRALLALALRLNNPQEDSRIKTLLSDLQNGAIASATGMHWEEQNPDPWGMNTDTRSTAIVLDALARLDPNNQLNANVVRWLMVARRAGHWETTQETAWAILGLTDWMVASGELAANYSYRVSLNGTELKRGEANAGNLQEPVQLQVAVKDLVREQANALTFQRDAGPGRLYYTAHLQTYIPVENVRALSRGVIVGRQYRLVTDACRKDSTVPCPAASSAKLGDEIQVRLTIVAPNDLHYVVVEDPLPAGAEAVDTSLLTTSVVGKPPELTPVQPGYGPGWGWWWFSHSELRDEKVVLFATYLPAGTYEYVYTMRASLPGQFKVLPTTAREFYFPEVFGRSDGMLFPIEGQ